MRSIFRYPGGKTQKPVRRWIRSHMPSGVKEYREPFVGGGGVFFSLNPSDIPSRWINDIHPGLISVYQALRERPDEFIAKCREIEPARTDDPLTDTGPRGGERINARLKKVFDEVAFDGTGDQAFRYFFVNRTVFGGRVNYDIPSRLYFSNPSGWNIVADDSLEKAARVLKDVRVTCGSYQQLFDEPGDDVWIYADPPYVVNTGLTRTSQLYQHGFSEDDHREFARVVKFCPHRICLSYDDDPFVRELYPESDGFHYVQTSWAYAGTTNAVKKQGKELLILNYDPPSTLFSADLGLSDKGDFQRLEAIIDRGRKTFVDVGLALREIRDRRLYRASHKTFEDYCASRWGMNRDYGDKLVRAAETVAHLHTIVCKSPSNESHVRELIRLSDSDEQVAAWQATIARSETEEIPITAKLVREEVARFLPERIPTHWRTALERAWKLVPDEDHEEAMDFLETLKGACAT